MGTEGISVADALALRNTGYDGNSNDGFGGNNGAWWVIILILFFAVGGWGRGFNNGNDGNGSGTGTTVYPTQPITDAFNFNQLDNGIRGVTQGLCDGFYAMSNAINTVNSNVANCCCEVQQGQNGINQNISNLGYQVAQGFCGTDKSIMQNTFQNQAGFTALGNQLATCCCDIEAGQKDLQYALAQSTNSVLASADKNADRIINYLTQTEMDRLRTELQSAQFQLSQLSQTSNIINQLMPVAKPAYITCSPYAAAMGYPYNTANGFGYGCNACA